MKDVNMVKRIKAIKGQSIIEILIALLIVSLVLTAVVSGVLLAIKSTQYSKHKTQANFLSQEGIEWVRAEKLSMSWTSFVALASVGTTDYCLQNLEFSVGLCSPADLIDGLYLRDLRLTTNAVTNEVIAEIEISWLEGEKEFSSIINTTFYERNLED